MPGISLMESSFQPAITWTICNNLITGSVAKQCKELILARLSIILQPEEAEKE
jgi:hypothetical protein